MLNRELGNVSRSGQYFDDAVGWRLDGRLPFADRSFHDDEVCAMWWDGGDLVFAIEPEGYGEPPDERIEFADARVVSEDGWFDALRIIWMHHELTILEGGYEVSVIGISVADETADREVRITLRAREIRVVVDGTVVRPDPGRLPESLLIRALNENAPEERRAEAKRRILAQPGFSYDRLVHPFPWKECWEGCAEVLSGLGDEALSPLLPGLLECLIDLGWPGAQRVFARLKKMSIGSLAPALEAAETRARAEDAEWLRNLARLRAGVTPPEASC